MSELKDDVLPQRLLRGRAPLPADQPVPFNRACLTGREFVYMAQALEHMHISGDGEYSKACQRLLQDMLKVPRVLLTTSCTHALEMCALLLEVQPGQEVIVPSYTFVSTANAFALRGAKIVFADIRPDTLNIDETTLPGLITPNTAAVVAVHYAGVACEMDALTATCRQHGLKLVEDNAHGLFGKYRGQPLGTFGALSALSFHETKNVSCGEGGALVINDRAYASEADIIRDKGTNRARYFRGEVDKYTWVGMGSSYLPSDLLAAFLLAQLESQSAIQRARRHVWQRYHAGLAHWAAENHVRQPVVPAHCEQAYHMYYLILPTPGARDRLIAHLQAHQIHSVFHYQPLHRSEMGQRYGGQRAHCPVTEDVSGRLLRLPFFNDLSEEDQSRVVEAIAQFRC